jgi:hypothetical protein
MMVTGSHAGRPPNLEYLKTCCTLGAQNSPIQAGRPSVSGSKPQSPVHYQHHTAPQSQLHQQSYKKPTMANPTMASSGTINAEEEVVSGSVGITCRNRVLTPNFALDQIQVVVRVQQRGASDSNCSGSTSVSSNASSSASTNSSCSLSQPAKRSAEEPASGEANGRAGKKPAIRGMGPFPLCAGGPDSRLWDRTECIWDCLACGKRNCEFEIGTATLLDAEEEKEKEYDLCECDPGAALTRCTDWNRGTAYQFDRLSDMIKHLVSAAIFSKGFWSCYKYVGTKTLDLKIRTWTRWRCGKEMAEKNWVPLRRAVKESLRYRRKLCCTWLHDSWCGKCCFGLFIGYVWLSATNHHFL